MNIIWVSFLQIGDSDSRLLFCLWLWVSPHIGGFLSFSGTRKEGLCVTSIGLNITIQYHQNEHIKEWYKEHEEKRFQCARESVWSWEWFGEWLRSFSEEIIKNKRPTCHISVLQSVKVIVSSTRNIWEYFSEMIRRVQIKEVFKEFNYRASSVHVEQL